MNQPSGMSGPGGHQNGQAEPLISFTTDDNDTGTNIEINTPLLNRMVEMCGTRPICIYSVCGPARQGKSFLLGYMIRRLIAMEKGDVDWMCKTGERRNWPLSATGSFEFRNQYDPLTEGIMIWNRPFIVTNDGQEFAVLLVDTQGTFDSSTSTRDMTAIVSLSLLTCSVMVFNFFTNLQEDTLTSFNTFVQYGKLALEKSCKDLRPFQKLVFLIRDWNNRDEFPFGGQGGRHFLERKLEANITSSKEASEVRTSIRQCFEEIECYLMPHIGHDATKKTFTGSVAELEPLFAEKLEDFIGNLISADALVPKQILGNAVTAREFQLYLNQYVNTFISHDIPEPITIWEATSQIFYTNLVAKCARKYVDIIQNAESDHAYLTMNALEGAHQQGLKKSQGIFEDAGNVGDGKQSGLHSSILITKIEQVYQHLQQSHQQRRDIFIQSITKNAVNLFKSELTTKFPLNAGDFYSDHDITEGVIHIKAAVNQNFSQQFPNEVDAQRKQLILSLDKDIDEVITQHITSNNLLRSNAEKKIRSLVTQLVSQYKADMLELFSTNTYVCFEQFRSNHITLKEIAIRGTKFSKYPKVEEKFVTELSTKLEQEYDNFVVKQKLHLKEVETNAEQALKSVVARHAQMVTVIANHDVSNKEQLLENLITPVLTHFLQTSNPYPTWTPLQNQLQQKLKLELEKVTSSVLRDVRESLRKFEDSNRKAVESALENYKEQFTSTSNAIKSNPIEDIGEQEHRYNEVCANAVDKYESILKVGTPNSSIDYKTELKQKLSAIFQEHMQQVDVERKALEVQAKQCANECLNEYQNFIRKLITTVKSVKELETSHKIGLESAMATCKRTCRRAPGPFRDQLVNTLEADIVEVYTIALEYVELRIKQESREFELLLQNARKLYREKMEKHFDTSYNPNLGNVKEFHLQAVNHAISSRKDLSDQIKDNLKQKLDAHLSEYIGKSDMILSTKIIPAIGIDLGITNSYVGVWTPNGVKIIPNSDQGNSNATPSYVTLGQNGEVTSYGKESKDSMHENPECTLFDFKRLLGRPFADETVQRYIKLWPFTVVDDMDQPKIKIGETLYHPEEICGKFLSQLRKMTEKHLKLEDGAIQNAVIAVPNYFTEAQAQATIDAGELAGLNVLQIIKEPIAAAVAYRIQTLATHPEKVVAFDLGSDAFDVAVVEVLPGADGVKVLGANGSVHFGGQDIDDNLLLNYVFEELKRKEMVDILDGINSSDTETRDVVRSRLNRLRWHLEQFKIALSTSEKVHVTMMNLVKGKNLDVEVTREKFNQVNEPLFLETIKMTEKCLRDAQVRKEDIQKVILVGGSTRIPKIQELLQQFFDGKCPDISINPEEVVAYGAAVKAAMLHGEQALYIGNL